MNEPRMKDLEVLAILQNSIIDRLTICIEKLSLSLVSGDRSLVGEILAGGGLLLLDLELADLAFEEFGLRNKETKNEG